MYKKRKIVKKKKKNSLYPFVHFQFCTLDMYYLTPPPQKNAFLLKRLSHCKEMSNF